MYRFRRTRFARETTSFSPAQNNYAITLGFSTIALDRAFETAGFRPRSPAPSPDRDLRALVYMIRCAFAHDMMHPVWQARGRAYARKLTVSLPSGSLILDMAALHDKPFHDADIGGIDTYFETRDAVIEAVNNKLSEA